MRQIKESPYPSGGRNPQSPSQRLRTEKYLYVANHDDNTIVEFAVGTDAKIYPINTYQTPGSFPTSLTIDANRDLRPSSPTHSSRNTTPARPGPGALVIYPINPADGSLGEALTDTANGTAYFPACNNPIAVTVLNNTAAGI